MKPYKVIAMPWRAECSRPLLATFRFVRFPRERNVFFSSFSTVFRFFFSSSRFAASLRQRQHRDEGSTRPNIPCSTVLATFVKWWCDSMESLIARIARNEENPVNRDLPRFTEIYRVFKVFIAVNQVSFSSSRGFLPSCT